MARSRWRVGWWEFSARSNHSRFSVCGPAPGERRTIATPEVPKCCDDHWNPPADNGPTRGQIR